jgi:hypothetical protein
VESLTTIITTTGTMRTDRTAMMAMITAATVDVFAAEVTPIRRFVGNVPAVVTVRLAAGYLGCFRSHSLHHTPLVVSFPVPIEASLRPVCVEAMQQCPNLVRPHPGRPR